MNRISVLTTTLFLLLTFTAHTQHIATGNKNQFGVVAGVSFPVFGFVYTTNNHYGKTENGLVVAVSYSRDLDTGIHFIAQYQYNNNAANSAGITTKFYDVYGNEYTGPVNTSSNWRMHSLMGGFGLSVRLDDAGYFMLKPKALVGFSSITNPQMYSTVSYRDRLNPYTSYIQSIMTTEETNQSLSYALAIGLQGRFDDFIFHVEASYFGSSFTNEIQLVQRKTNNFEGTTKHYQPIHMMSISGGLLYAF